MKNFAIFVSGRGTNMENILRHVRSGKIRGRAVLVFSDNPKALALRKAAKFKVPVCCLERNAFADKAGYESAIVSELKKHGVEFIVLAGFMRIVGPTLIQAFAGKILNIHPALLPSFKGAHAIKDAFDYGVKITGVTVHLVDEEVDHGPIFLQKEVPVKAKDTLAALEKRVHQAEYELYPQAIQLFMSGKWRLQGRKIRA